jgi:arylsulfatase A-like enzyme
VKPDKYLTDAFSDAAVEFINESHEQPFFLYLSYNAPHAPLQATDAYLSRFPDIKDPKRRTYAAMVSAMDDGVGRVLAALKERGLDDNTLVFFLSDNGGPTQNNGSRNTPLRGNKGDVWEGGWRVPFALRWPGNLSAGTHYDKPVSALDIFATIASLAEVPLDSEKPLDGVNLVPFLNGDKPGPAHEAVYLRKFDQQAYAVRRGDFKLVIPGKAASPLLFDLNRDIGERNNVILSRKETADDIDLLRLQWDAQLTEPRFLGLIHTDSWQKSGKAKDKKDGSKK